jgi:hypothetical protein
MGILRFIGGRQPGELKHLINLRKRNQIRDIQSSGERNEYSLNLDASRGVAGLQRGTKGHSRISGGNRKPEKVTAL